MKHPREAQKGDLSVANSGLRRCFAVQKLEDFEVDTGEFLDPACEGGLSVGEVCQSFGAPITERRVSLPRNIVRTSHDRSPKLQRASASSNSRKQSPTMLTEQTPSESSRPGSTLCKGDGTANDGESLVGYSVVSGFGAPLSENAFFGSLSPETTLVSPDVQHSNWPASVDAEDGLSHFASFLPSSDSDEEKKLSMSGSLLDIHRNMDKNLSERSERETDASVAKTTLDDGGTFNESLFERELTAVVCEEMCLPFDFPVH